MSIVLYRVDERLIHGQVVVGWGRELHPRRIVVVDDELASSTWEQELYTLGLPPELAAEFTTVASARAQLGDWRKSAEPTIVLTRDIANMRRLAQDGAMKGEDVNIGGIHHAPGRRPILPYLYLSEDEFVQLRTLATEGVNVSARDLPGARRVEVNQFVPVERRT